MRRDRLNALQTEQAARLAAAEQRLLAPRPIVRLGDRDASSGQHEVQLGDRTDRGVRTFNSSQPIGAPVRGIPSQSGLWSLDERNVVQSEAGTTEVVIETLTVFYWFEGVVAPGSASNNYNASKLDIWFKWGDRAAVRLFQGLPCDSLNVTQQGIGETLSSHLSRHPNGNWIYQILVPAPGYGALFLTAILGVERVIAQQLKIQPAPAISYSEEFSVYSDYLWRRNQNTQLELPFILNSDRLLQAPGSGSYSNSYLSPYTYWRDRVYLPVGRIEGTEPFVRLRTPGLTILWNGQYFPYYEILPLEGVLQGIELEQLQLNSRRKIRLNLPQEFTAYGYTETTSIAIDSAGGRQGTQPLSNIKAGQYRREQTAIDVDTSTFIFYNLDLDSDPIELFQLAAIRLLLP